jgi:hypothetical protein
MDFFRVCNSKWRKGERKRNISSVIIHSNRRSNVYAIIFLGFLSFFRCQQISPWKLRFVCVIVQATESGGALEWEKKKHSNIRYKKEHFYSLNNVYHGHKDTINNGIVEHKAPSSAKCPNSSKLPSSLARRKYRWNKRRLSQFHYEIATSRQHSQYICRCRWVYWFYHRHRREGFSGYFWRI